MKHLLAFLILLQVACGERSAGARRLLTQAQGTSRVVLYLDAMPAGLDTVFMDRPTWGVLKARVYYADGSINPTAVVKWIVGDSTVVRFRQLKAQSVVIEAPMTSRLAKTRVIVGFSGRRDTVLVKVRQGIAAVIVKPDSATVDIGQTKAFCAYWKSKPCGTGVTCTGGGKVFPAANNLLSCPLLP